MLNYLPFMKIQVIITKKSKNLPHSGSFRFRMDISENQQKMTADFICLPYCQSKYTRNKIIKTFSLQNFKFCLTFLQSMLYYGEIH